MGLRRLEPALSSSVRRYMFSPSGGSGGGVPSVLGQLAPSFSVALQRSSGLLWTNSTKTTPAVNTGDPVRVATCPFTGVDYTAASNGVRPILTDTGGGTWALIFDGTDDCMTCPRSALTDAIAHALTVGISSAWTDTAASTSRYQWFRGSIGDNCIGMGYDSVVSYPYVTTVLNRVFFPVTPTYDTTARVTMVRRSGPGTTNIRLDGVAVPGTAGNVAIGASGNVGITVGAFNNGGTPALWGPFKMWGFLPYGGISYDDTTTAAIEATLAALHP